MNQSQELTGELLLVCGMVSLTTECVMHVSRVRAGSRASDSPTKCPSAATATRHLLVTRNLHFACPSSCIGLWDLVSAVTRISGEQNNFSDRLVLSAIISAIKTTQLTTQWQVWQVSQPSSKPQTCRYFLWCWRCFTSKAAALRFLSCKQIFWFCSQNWMLLSIRSCTPQQVAKDCHQILLAVAWKASIEKYFSPGLGHCMPVAFWCSGISWKKGSVQFSPLSFLRPAPHFTVKHHACLILSN